MNIVLEISSPGAATTTTTLEEFICSNDELTAEDVAQLSSLAIEESMKLGGGAAPLFTVRRMA